MEKTHDGKAEFHFVIQIFEKEFLIVFQAIQLKMKEFAKIFGMDHCASKQRRLV